VTPKVRSAALALCAIGVPAAHGSTACGEILGTEAQRLSDARYQLVFKATPSPIPLGQHFRLDFALCPIAPAAAPSEVRVDAHMPEHRHGMNYRPDVRSLGAGLYRAGGLMFHMPGRWELVFDVRSSDGTARLAQTLLVE
jgi:hypothetical protein